MIPSLDRFRLEAETAVHCLLRVERIISVSFDNFRQTPETHRTNVFFRLFYPRAISKTGHSCFRASTVFGQSCPPLSVELSGRTETPSEAAYRILQKLFVSAAWSWGRFERGRKRSLAYFRAETQPGPRCKYLSCLARSHSKVTVAGVFQFSGIFRRIIRDLRHKLVDFLDKSIKFAQGEK